MSAGVVLGSRYELIAQLGVGGFGSVWRARDSRLKRDVAVKLLRVVGGDIPRFEREAQALAQLNNPHVVSVHDFGIDGADAYLVLELVVGRSLADELAAMLAVGHVGLPLPRVLDIADQILDGLSAAHAAGFIHRDLKPDNVMLAASGPEVKIVDFGIAHAIDLSRITATGSIVGTLPYIAPEQLNGDPLDGRADLYSLGCMLHELLTGTSPYRANTPGSWVQAHHLQPPAHVRDRLPDLPDAVDTFIQRLLAKDPDERPANAAAARAILARSNPHATPAPTTPADDDPTRPATVGSGPPPQTPSSPRRISPISPTVISDHVATSPGYPTIIAGSGQGQIDIAPARRRRYLVIAAVTVLIVTALVFTAIRYAPAAGGNPTGHQPQVTNPSTPAATSTPGAPLDAFPDKYVGTWSGRLLENNKRSWDMTVRIDPNSATAVVEYPQLNCSGVWTLTGGDQSGLDVRERITQLGGHACTLTGRLSLSLSDDGRMHINYLPDGASYTGTGILTRG